MVILSEKEYERLHHILHGLVTSGVSPSREDFLVTFSSIDFNAILSLFYQMFVRYAKKRTLQFNKRTLGNWVQQVDTNGNKLKDIAVRGGYSSYKVAKCFLSHAHRVELTEFMEEPSAILNDKRRYWNVSFSIIRIASRRTFLSFYSFDVLECCVEDPLCSTIVDIRKNCMGKEFESYLERRLKDLNICFETELELRMRGKPKTPDILLSIPMLVYLRGGLRVLVNWIDSKGMFADIETMTEHETVSNIAFLIYNLRSSKHNNLIIH